MNHISSFREGSDGASGLVWVEKMNAWICGGSNGTIFSKVEQRDHESTDLDKEDTITAIAIDPTKDECVVAERDSLSVRSLTNLDSLIQSEIYKTTLPFTHLEFDHTGCFL